MKYQNAVKYTVIPVAIFLAIYLLIDQIFIRGRLVATYQASVVSASDIPNVKGANLYQATVKLDNGSHVNIICQRRCIVGQEITVQKFEALVGQTENYYSGI